MFQGVRVTTSKARSDLQFARLDIQRRQQGINRSGGRDACGSEVEQSSQQRGSHRGMTVKFFDGCHHILRVNRV